MQFFVSTPGSRPPIQAVLKRFANSTVVWSWILNGLRAGSGLIVLPLLFRQLSTSEFGMYGVLLALTGIAAIVDFGFGPTIDRSISYAMGGAETLEALGVPQRSASHQPNYRLLWQLLVTTRRLYRYLTVILFLTLGAGGTIMVENLIRTEHALHPGFSMQMSRLAWAVTLLSTLLDIYSNWWGIYLRGLNEVRAATKVAALAAVTKFVITVVLLLSGAGLLSLPIAGIASSFIQRHYARVRCLKLLPPQPQMDEFSLKKNLAVLWPNSWRQGVQLMSSFLIVYANTFICAHVYHLEITGIYTASVQLIGYAASMATVWTMIKWPLIGQYQARHDYPMIRRILWPRIWLQTATFLILAGGVIFIGPGFLHWIGKDKELLPMPWMFCLMFSTFMSMQLSTYGTLIATGNWLPFVWPSVAANVLTLILTLALLRFTSLGLGSFILAPILIGCLFNYWYWPFYAARGMKTTLLRFLFLGPDAKAKTN